MRTSIFATAFIFVFAAFAAAQGPPPPPAPAPDYSPNGWKEYTFKDDGVRFRFPVEPKRRDDTLGADVYPTHVYERNSFMRFELTVITRPSNENLEERGKAGLNAARDGALNNIKNLQPKIIKDEEITVDGHSGKFVQIETNDGRVYRTKCFFVANRMYIATTIVEKGKRHGFNWENDFELPAMAFLDSIHVITG
jgi:hypothetical protein